MLTVKKLNEDESVRAYTNDIRSGNGNTHHCLFFLESAQYATEERRVTSD
jgi:hypothetical protein